MKTTQTNTTDGLTHDDMDMLKQVLVNVRGAYPDSPYRQADYDVVDYEDFDEELQAEA